MTLVVVGIRNLLLSARVRRDGLRAVGQVVGHDLIEGDGTTSYKPVVRFTDNSGVGQQFRASGHSSRRFPPVGAEVPVVYLPDGVHPPQLALAHCDLGRKLLVVLAGVVFIGAAVLIGLS